MRLFVLPVLTACLAVPAAAQEVLTLPIPEVQDAPVIVLEEVLPPAPESTETVPENPYYDDRSTSASIIDSLYNAINRQEYLRAWSYFEQAYSDADIEAMQADFDAFAAGYADTQSVDILIGAEITEGTAGTQYSAIPVALAATQRDGSTESFAGCYTLSLPQPGNQATPPFRPLSIVSSELAPAEGALEAILPASCTPQ
ncbi:hypothetical protein [Pelagibacterium luteolum]|uniref:Uncharacterized protein n=1 Tax=Pelagibacterium luteolum TaxID=440168 RepID=A0A1G7Y5K8_9HYPH|nr:hypothetical protein [Pelagibacterium luteolum]SDG91643.1 hypothetical protein SAMN04487974_11263 [Pelagibacterium luteolum]